MAWGGPDDSLVRAAQLRQAPREPRLAVRPAESRAEPLVASRPGPASCPGHPGLDERGTVSSRAVQVQGNGGVIGPRRHPARDRPPSRVGLDPPESFSPN